MEKNMEISVLVSWYLILIMYIVLSNKSHLNLDCVYTSTITKLSRNF